MNNSVAFRNTPVKRTRVSHLRRRGLSAPQIDSRTQTGPGQIRRLLDLALRAGWAHAAGPQTAGGLEWALVDTRLCDPGAYLIRGWTDGSGVTRRVERSAGLRYGGAIGLFTLRDRCVSVGPCSPIVDEGAGLLLMGFAHMMTLPLPRRAAEALDANWLLVMTDRCEALRDSEVGLLLVLVRAVLDEHGLGAASERTRTFRALHH